METEEKALETMEAPRKDGVNPTAGSLSSIPHIRASSVDDRQGAPMHIGYLLGHPLPLSAGWGTGWGQPWFRKARYCKLVADGRHIFRPQSHCSDGSKQGLPKCGVRPHENDWVKGRIEGFPRSRCHYEAFGWVEMEVQSGKPARIVGNCIRVQGQASSQGLRKLQGRLEGEGTRKRFAMPLRNSHGALPLS